MTDRHGRPPHDRFHGYAVATLEGIVLLAACAVLLAWAWNALGVELFHLPRAQFKHALALEAAVAGLVVLAGWAGRLGRRREGAGDAVATRAS
jgi:hypothetical protein